MLYVGRTLTGVAFALTSVLFGAIGYKCFLAVVRHVQSGNPNTAIIPLLIGFFAIVVVIGSLLPTSRRNLRSFASGFIGRFLFFLFALLVISVASLAALMFLHDDNVNIFGVIPARQARVAFAVYAFLYVSAFIYPGFFFFKSRTTTASNSGFAPVGDAGSRAYPAPAPKTLFDRVISALNFVIWGSLVAVFAYSFHATFLPAPDFLRDIDNYRIGIIGGSAVFLSASLILGSRNKPGKGIFQHKIPQAFGLAAMGTASAFLTPSIASVSLPAIHSMMTKAPVVSQDVIVVAQGTAHRRRACDHTAKVVWPEYPEQQLTLCDVPEDIWAKLSRGDILQLTGPRTEYGLRYNTIVLLTDVD